MKFQLRKVFYDYSEVFTDTLAATPPSVFNCHLFMKLARNCFPHLKWIVSHPGQSRVCFARVTAAIILLMISSSQNSIFFII